MFKPVQGDALKEFDAETRALYARRQSDSRLTEALLTLPRPSRNNLPVVAAPNNATVAERTAYAEAFPYKLLASCAFFSFACVQFSKIYFPYGIILRRSIPQTWNQYVAHRAPIGLVFLVAWYYQREYPRTQRMDLSCSSEN